MVQCGEDFSLAGTSTNSVYFWGTRRKKHSSRNTSAKIGYAEIKTNRLETIPSVNQAAEGLPADALMEGKELCILKDVKEKGQFRIG